MSQLSSTKNDLVNYLTSLNVIEIKEEMPVLIGTSFSITDLLSAIVDENSITRTCEKNDLNISDVQKLLLRMGLWFDKRNGG